MKLIDIEELNHAFAINTDDTSVNFIKGHGGLPQLSVKNQTAHALINLQGAHLLEWSPLGHGDIIWLSDDATFAQGKSVRGGIPVCWPWFGAHDSNPDYPAHGFARTVFWQVVKTTELSSDETEIIFELNTEALDAKHQAMWPYATGLNYRMVIATDLSLQLSTQNNCEQTFTLGQALHTYFYVADVTTTKVYGLEDKDYLDKTDNFKRKTQQGPITIESEVDRVYLDTADEVIIDTRQRKIHITKQGSRSTVVWNPWQQVAARMGDLGENGYLKMLCVETANAAEDTVQLTPGEQHTMSLTYHIE